MIADFLQGRPLAQESLKVAWHAGEPLILRRSFYRDAFLRLGVLERDGLHIQHVIQTNGTLLDQDWCDFVKKHKVHIGVSLDGPPYINDAQRVDRLGRGTFDRTMRGIRLLQRNKIPFGVIAVLTRESLRYPDELWDFFVGNGITDIALNVEEQEDANATSSLIGPRARSDYAAFLRRWLQRRARHPEVKVRELDDAARNILDCEGIAQSSENLPGAILSFDWQGNISTFSPELLTMKHPRFGEFKWGHVARDSYQAVMCDERFLEVSAEISRGVQACRDSCEYFSLCGGGAPVNKLSENGSFATSETVYCSLRIKAVTDVVLRDLERAEGGVS